MRCAPGTRCPASALLREEHLKRVEDCLQGAVDAARLGGIGYDEVAETLRLLWEG